jgi:tRNA(Ile)-lysidine synthase
LGHHADDQAEVILKRVFEGSSLFSLSGLEFDRSIEGMKVWRPLLGVQKKTVLDWLKKQNLTFFTDPTNHSSSNLRGKMRKEILPFLNESFGKDIASNLCSLAGECQELREHFSALNQPILMQIKKEGENFCLDLNPFLPLSAMQLKYLLKELMGKQEIAVKSKFQIERGFLYFSEN